MSKPRYPLQTVLELRERERDAAQEALASRLREREQAATELESRTTIKERADTRVEAAVKVVDAPPTDGSALDIREVNRRAEEVIWLRGVAAAAATQLEQAQRELAAADAAVEQARADLVQAAQGLTAIETHRDTWLAELRKELERKEEALMQEVALSAWVRAGSEGNS